MSSGKEDTSSGFEGGVYWRFHCPHLVKLYDNEKYVTSALNNANICPAIWYRYRRVKSLEVSCGGNGLQGRNNENDKRNGKRRFPFQNLSLYISEI